MVGDKRGADLRRVHLAATSPNRRMTPNQAVVEQGSSRAISGNIGSCRWPYGACFRSGPSSRHSRTAPRSAKFPITPLFVHNPLFLSHTASRRHCKATLAHPGAEPRTLSKGDAASLYFELASVTLPIGVR